MPSSHAPWRVVTAKPEQDACFSVVFHDGLEGRVDMAAFLRHRRVTATVFEALRDPAFFQTLRVEQGAVVWPNGADLAPDAMYDAIAERGVWVVD
ncbi:MAG: DUF2442 domain-containing protein [Polyangiaceae bacterium]|nr:DUF2442 domain-containing protein [Polyangiaceae bacterium]